MTQGTSRGASVGPFAGLCALLIAALVIAALPVGASAAGRSVPPTSAALERSTQRLLDRPAYATLPSSILRGKGGSGGVGVSTGGTASGGVGMGSDSGDPLFPDNLFVTLYGAPQLVNTELGKRSPKAAARKVVDQSRPYERQSDEGVVAGFDLIGVVANSTPGPDRKYRTRQPDELIATYLKHVRKIDGRLMLDIQPGRSSALREIVALQDWFAEPDVDVGIDPEWNVGSKGVPGETTGSITAGEINRASRRLDQIVADENLPPKVMIVHQFTERMIRNRGAIKQRDGVQVTLNFDGIGSRPAKEAGYASLATKTLFNGFSIFYRLDMKVMSPSSILGLVPTVSFLLYQ